MDVKENNEELVREVLFTEKQVNQAADRCAEWLGGIIKTQRGVLVFYMLEGCRTFAQMLEKRLLRAGIEKELIPIRTSSYQETTQSSEVVNIEDDHIQKDQIKGKTVVLIDDILDTGGTMSSLRKRMLEYGAAKVQICVLIERDIERDVNIKADMAGLKTQRKEYLAGVGLDYKGLLRELPYIAAIE
ncbi:Hypoxanthine-guanine phosphoribosyltransferase [Sedimentisphaera salicampi]|uniref:Hypoxanthine-guanine phosphoribosyltransferase n=2 Tax=Sedimentisphaera salicampi TaxID=1941349 RepID=A0A1W6LPF6_9BACT|nr:Hypoxanthine-guanine phosphoribosyltransferase [Sedimentisphaera salicampi]OXU14324.1 Hypoxanthine-guanine phosphoribosyltransferase [Sedimentisphaera salicampi]